jgi:hypothetical protein
MARAAVCFVRLMFNYADHHIEAAFWAVHVLKLFRVHCRLQPSSSCLLEKWPSLQVRTRIDSIFIAQFWWN